MLCTLVSLFAKVLRDDGPTVREAWAPPPQSPRGKPPANTQVGSTGELSVCAGKCPTSGRFSVTGSGITVTHVKVISCLEYVLGDWARIVIGSVGDIWKLLGWVQSLHL